jgi:hypothetical protein
MYHFVLAIIPAKGIPRLVFPTVAHVKELPGIPSVHAQSLQFIFNGMGMHDIHDHGDAMSMSFIDQFLELVGCAEPGADCK